MTEEGLTIATPQMTVRVDVERQDRWKQCSEANGYTVSELIRRLMDGVCDGDIEPPPPPRTGVCRFGGVEGCNQPRLEYPWSVICSSCGHRDR